MPVESNNFNIRGVITAQDAKATKYNAWIHQTDNSHTTAGTDVMIDNSGNKAANVPNFMANITPEYTNNSFYANVTWSYMGARQANFANAFELPAFSQFNLAMGYDISSKLRVSANVNNVLNSYSH